MRDAKAFWPVGWSLSHHQCVQLPRHDSQHHFCGIVQRGFSCEARWGWLGLHDTGHVLSPRPCRCQLRPGDPRIDCFRPGAAETLRRLPQSRPSNHVSGLLAPRPAPELLVPDSDHTRLGRVGGGLRARVHHPHDSSHVLPWAF